MKAVVGMPACPMEGLPPPESRHVVLTKLEGNEYVLRVPRGGKSAVWKIFLHVLTMGGQKVDFVLCRYCCGLFMYKGYASGTSSLMNHGIRCLDRPKRPDECTEGANANVLIHEDWPDAFKEQPYFSLSFLKRYKQGDRRPPSPCLPIKYAVSFKVEAPSFSLDSTAATTGVGETQLNTYPNYNNNTIVNNNHPINMVKTNGTKAVKNHSNHNTTSNKNGPTIPNNNNNHKVKREVQSTVNLNSTDHGSVPGSHTIPLYTALHVAAQSFGVPLDLLLKLADGVVGQRSMLQDDNGELSSGGGSVGLSGIEAVVAAAAAAAAAAGDPGPAVSGASQTSTDNHMMMGGGAMTSSISSSAAAREAAIGMSPPSVTSPNKPESYQLRHNNHLSLVLNQLAEDEAFMDVTLTAEGRSVKAHKSVLSAVSPYFSAVLRANPCQHPIIIMPRDVRYAELSNIIMYIYKGEMTVSAEDLPSLLKTAELLRITGLSPGENATSSQQPLTRTTNLSSSSSTVTANSFAGLFNGSMNPTSTSYSTPPHSESSRVLGSPRHEHLLQTTPIKKSSGSCLAKATPVRIESPTPDPTMLNPSDFMDLDMTCVKEELNSEEEDEEDIPKSPSPKEVTTPPPVENPLSSDSRDRHPPDARLDQEDPDTQPNLEAASDDHDSSHLRQSSHQSSSSPAGQREDSDNEIKRSSLKTLANLASLDTPTNLSPCDDSSSSSSSSLPDTSEILPNVCPYCSEYVVGNDMSSHLSTKHAFKPAFICSECQRVFTRKNVREMHAKDCKKET
ncbi:protein abrupt isoform X3 [Hyalella azteca]|uniref:Protein abrupt isoform X3 n=1 Tax=Hyalella azteca TaxID=294128 RepID=A0A8B7MYJ7_HYAAZ|nr:protein abrupt isoform X3 [Hyalella azteca]